MIELAGEATPGTFDERPPSLLLRWLAWLLPLAERGEVLADLADELAERRRRGGGLAARLWLWRQIAASVPALLRRSWWRGWAGFEPESSRFRPGGTILEGWALDLRFTLRRLASRPAYASLAVATLVLGVGGTAAVFDIAREILVDPSGSSSRRWARCGRSGPCSPSSPPSPSAWERWGSTA